MDQLLAARFLQGLGGGGLGAVAMATVADIVPARQLGRWLGYQGVIFAVASAVGPLVGGLFVEHLSWRWAFFVNLPIGLVAATIVATRLRLPYRRIPHALDWAGAALLTSGLALFVLLATLGGHEIPWRSPRAIALIALVVLLGGLFVRRERRAPEPVLPLAPLPQRGGAGVAPASTSPAASCSGAGSSSSPSSCSRCGRSAPPGQDSSSCRSCSAPPSARS